MTIQEGKSKKKRDDNKKIKKANYLEIGNRSKAIKFAIQKSEPKEIILIAGKGHETTQDYGKKILKISDRSIIKNMNFIGKKNLIKVIITSILIRKF